MYDVSLLFNTDLLPMPIFPFPTPGMYSFVYWEIPENCITVIIDAISPRFEKLPKLYVKIMKEMEIIKTCSNKVIDPIGC